MNWDRYLEIKKQTREPKKHFVPDNQNEAKQALALGVIDISDYVEFSLNTEPLLDSIHDPDPKIRKQTIHKIAERKTPFSHQLLFRMLLDEDEETRIYAAAEIDRLEYNMQNEIHQWREAIKLHPHSSESRFQLAKIYIEYSNLLIQSKRLRHFFLQEAITLLNKNLAQKPNHAEFLYYRGWAFQLQNDLKNALADLKRSILLDRNQNKNYVLLAEIYFRLKRYDFVKRIMNLMPVRSWESEDFYVHLFWKDDKYSA